MTFNKKQMQPLIDKYQINPETNKLFIKVCEMFDGQPNYQVWAVKMIFSQNLTYDELNAIHDWATKNQGMIKFLDKKNIVSYSTRNAIIQLMNEMKGIDNITLIKNIISHFNTDQRKILTLGILPKEYTPLEAYNDRVVNEWAKIFLKFAKLPMARRNNFYTICSSIRNLDSLRKQFNNALEEQYEWNKEDMIAFMENNTEGCEIVFNQGPYVIVRVGNFDASRKLCGGGRTQWCITKESHYFSDYAGSSYRDQYFYFDFSRKETDCFAHVGFTIENGNNVVYAQSCDNRDMRNELRQDNEVTNFNELMEKAHVKMSIFMRLKEKCKFDWDILSVIDMVNGAPEDYAIAYECDNVLVLNILSIKGFNKIFGHTYISANRFSFNDNLKTYAVLNFAQSVNDDKSLVAMLYRKSQYGDLELTNMTDVFGKDIMKSDYLSSIGLSSDKFLNRESIDPRILLHKYIDENDEIAAINLIKKEGKNFDVNYKFNNRIPIFSACNCKMYNLFDTIVNHPKWDSSIEDGFGDSLLEALVNMYSCYEITLTNDDETHLKKMIDSLLNSNYIDFNLRDINNDTVINIACEFPKLKWVVKALASKRNVDVNVVNEFDSTAVSSCLRAMNLDALKIIGMRPDLRIRKTDENLAKRMGINLDDYIKPTDSIYKDDSTVMVEEESLEAVMTEI